MMPTGDDGRGAAAAAPPLPFRPSPSPPPHPVPRIDLDALRRYLSHFPGLRAVDLDDDDAALMTSAAVGAVSLVERTIDLRAALRGLAAWGAVSTGADRSAAAAGYAASRAECARLELFLQGMIAAASTAAGIEAPLMGGILTPAVSPPPTRVGNSGPPSAAATAAAAADFGAAAAAAPVTIPPSQGRESAPFPPPPALLVRPRTASANEEETKTCTARAKVRTAEDPAQRTAGETVPRVTGETADPRRETAGVVSKDGESSIEDGSAVAKNKEADAIDELSPAMAAPVPPPTTQVGRGAPRAVPIDSRPASTGGCTGDEEAKTSAPRAAGATAGLRRSPRAARKDARKEQKEENADGEDSDSSGEQPQTGAAPSSPSQCDDGASPPPLARATCPTTASANGDESTTSTPQATETTARPRCNSRAAQTKVSKEQQQGSVDSEGSDSHVEQLPPREAKRRRTDRWTIQRSQVGLLEKLRESSLTPKRRWFVGKYTVPAGWKVPEGTCRQMWRQWMRREDPNHEDEATPALRYLSGLNIRYYPFERSRFNSLKDMMQVLEEEVRRKAMWKNNPTEKEADKMYDKCKSVLFGGSEATEAEIEEREKLEWGVVWNKMCESQEIDGCDAAEAKIKRKEILQGSTARRKRSESRRKGNKVKGSPDKGEKCNKIDFKSPPTKPDDPVDIVGLNRWKFDPESSLPKDDTLETLRLKALSPERRRVVNEYRVTEKWTVPKGTCQQVWMAWMQQEDSESRKEAPPALRYLSDRNVRHVCRVHRSFSELQSLMEILEAEVRERGLWKENPTKAEAEEMYDECKWVLFGYNLSDDVMAQREMLQWEAVATHMQDNFKQHDNSQKVKRKRVRIDQDANLEALYPQRRVGMHMPVWVDTKATGRKNCKLCYLRFRKQAPTRVMCRVCGVPLCFHGKRNCFSQWHDTDKL